MLKNKTGSYSLFEKCSLFLLISINNKCFYVIDVFLLKIQVLS